MSDGSKHVRRGRRSPVANHTNPPVRTGRVKNNKTTDGNKNWWRR